MRERGDGNCGYNTVTEEGRENVRYAFDLYSGVRFCDVGGAAASFVKRECSFLPAFVGSAIFRPTVTCTCRIL